jgi:hypothetical protein
VYGVTNGGFGVLGTSDDATGVYGLSGSEIGVFGAGRLEGKDKGEYYGVSGARYGSNSLVGVYGESIIDYGVYGEWDTGVSGQGQTLEYMEGAKIMAYCNQCVCSLLHR